MSSKFIRGQRRILELYEDAMQGITKEELNQIIESFNNIPRKNMPLFEKEYDAIWVSSKEE